MHGDGRWGWPPGMVAGMGTWDGRDISAAVLLDEAVPEGCELLGLGDVEWSEPVEETHTDGNYVGESDFGLELLDSGCELGNDVGLGGCQDTLSFIALGDGIVDGCNLTVEGSNLLLTGQGEGGFEFLPVAISNPTGERLSGDADTIGNLLLG